MDCELPWQAMVLLDAGVVVLGLVVVVFACAGAIMFVNWLIP